MNGQITVSNTKEIEAIGKDYVRVVIIRRIEVQQLLSPEFR
jgi:hypothetical protein